jgi:hypothetical protein
MLVRMIRDKVHAASRFTAPVQAFDGIAKTAQALPRMRMGPVQLLVVLNAACSAARRNLRNDECSAMYTRDERVCWYGGAWLGAWLM